MDASDFCDWIGDGDRTECRRCGSVCYDGGVPTCPPWVTSVEPDSRRLPHIKDREQNEAVRRSWIDEQNYKLAANAPPFSARSNG